MTEQEARDMLTAAQIGPDAFWQVCQMRGDDGYDRIEAARSRGWDAIPSWGRDGWDLAAWPLAVVSHRTRDGGYELAENVEGDITVYRFATREERERATDYLAWWHWDHQGEGWVQGYTFETLPDYLRGPFTWARCDAERVRA